MARIGLSGLGIIGTAHAKNLLADGDEVVGFDLIPERRDVLTSLGGQAAASPKEVADQCDVIFSAVATLGSLSQIASGADGVIHSKKRGFVFVDVSTLSLAEKEAVRVDLEAAGIPMVDCTISGMGRQVELRDAVYIASGDPAAVTVVSPILQRWARACTTWVPSATGPSSSSSPT